MRLITGFLNSFLSRESLLILSRTITYIKEPLKSGGDRKVKEILKDESGQRITYDPALDIR